MVTYYWRGGGYKREVGGGHVKFYPYEKKGGGGAENILAMLKYVCVGGGAQTVLG